LTDAAVLAAVQGGANGAIGLAYVEWAGAGFQRLLVPWTRIAGPADAAAWAERLTAVAAASPALALPAYSYFPGTSIARGIRFSVSSMAEAPWEAARRVIDVSGDGVDNGGWPVEAARDSAVAEGVTVNGLAIEGDPDVQRALGPGARLAEYYRGAVAGGPGAFVVPADGVGAFRGAIRRKLVREIAYRRTAAGVA
jgi:hypothetical protein